MSVKSRVRYLPIAQDDLVSIFDFIAQDSLNRAMSFVEKFDERISLLARHPSLGRVPRHLRLREYGYRVLIGGSYLLFYIVRGREIEIHRVVHGSRDLDHLI